MKARLIAFAAVAALLLTAVPSLSAQAAGTSYYINNASGSGCSDSGPGTSTTRPWCSFTPANNHGAFTSGDRILLARGATFTQQLTLTGSGSATSVIELGAYGTGARPIISRNNAAADRAVRINNASFWLIHDLELANAGEGLLMYYDTKLREGVSIDNLYVHGISGIHQGNYSGTDQLGSADGIWNSSGIGFTGVVPATMAASEYMVKNVTVSNIEGTDNQSSIALDWFNGERMANGSTGTNNMVNVVFNRLYLHDDDGAGRSVGCDEGMRIVSATSVLLTNSRLVNEASCHLNTGTAAMLIGRVKNLTAQNNIFDTVANSGSPDQVGIDYEYLEDTAVLRDNVFTNIAGAAISYLNIHANDVNSHAASTANTFINNGEGSHRQDGTVGSLPTGTISDNVYAEPNQFTKAGGNFSGFTLSNNQAIGSASSVSAAGLGFSSTQGANGWTYQYLNGTTWTNLGYYDATRAVWQLSATQNVPQVGAFTEHPGLGATATVARTWTAPHAGLVSLRGIVFKPNDSLGGDGTTVSITQNATRIWPAAAPQTLGSNDQSGYQAALDQVTVAAGDQLHFITTPGAANDNIYDSTAWSPTVAFTSWEFEKPGDPERWSALNQSTVNVSGGALAVSNTGGDPYIGLPVSQAIDASKYRSVQVRMSNATGGTVAEMFFATTSAAGWSAAREVAVTVSPSSGFTTYTFNMASNPNWAGTITSLRFDPPGAASGSSAIDWIRVTP